MRACACVCHKFTQKPDQLSFDQIKPVVNGYKFHWTGKKNTVQNVLKILDSVCYALKMGALHVCVV